MLTSFGVGSWAGFPGNRRVKRLIGGIAGSVVGVLGSFYPLVTVVLAAVVLQERLGGRQRFGALGALAGVALIAAG